MLRNSGTGKRNSGQSSRSSGRRLFTVVAGLCLGWLSCPGTAGFLPGGVRAAEQAVAAASETDPRRPSAIETREVPVVPAEVFERLAQYQDIRSAGFSGWAPSGKGILIKTRFGNAAQLHRVYEPGGRREQVTFFQEPVNDGRFIRGAENDPVLITLSEGGNEDYQVYVNDLEAYHTYRITDGQSRNRPGPMTRDGKRMVLSNNARNGRDTDLYLVNPRDSDSLQMIFPTDRQFWYAADWSPDEKTLLLGQYVSVNESHFALLDVETHERTDLPLPGEEEQRVAIGDMQFAADGKSILMSLDAGSEFRRLARFDLAAHDYEWLTEDIPWDVTSIEVHPDTGDVAFVVNEDGASRLYWIEAATDRRIPLEIPLGIISDIEFSPQGDQLGFSLARPDAPADAYSVELSSGEVTRWTFSETGGLNPDSFIVPRPIQYESFDGRKIPAYYYLPQNTSRPVPVLIHIHGGPESQYRPYFSGATQYYVNELGIAVLAPNVRGSRGYGKTYLKLDNGERREDSVRDIGALLDWIEQQPELDASRVAVAGGSYGGYMVLGSLVNFPERIRAGIDFVGIANFITFLENTADYRRDLRRAEYGDERDPAMRKVFEQINPTARAERIRSALLVAHGKNDPRVPFSEAEQIAEKVRTQGRAVWTVFADNEGHGFGKKDNRDYFRGVQVMFLKQFLLDEE